MRGAQVICPAAAAAANSCRLSFPVLCPTSGRTTDKDKLGRLAEFARDWQPRNTLMPAHRDKVGRRRRSLSVRPLRRSPLIPSLVARRVSRPLVGPAAANTAGWQEFVRGFVALLVTAGSKDASERRDDDDCLKPPVVVC